MTKILNYRNMDDKERKQIKENIRKQLINKGYGNKRIDYEEFEKLHKEYGAGMSKTVFAIILGINDFSGLKYNNKSMTILKNKDIDKEEQKQREADIRNELINKGYGNKKIDYEEFKKLYEEYGNEMTKTKFGLILGIIDISNIKSGNAIILNYRDMDDKERKQIEENIRKQLIDKGYENKRIDYEEFKELHKEYGKGMEETEFAIILGINNFSSLKSNNKKTNILKNKDIDKEEQEQKQRETDIKNELLDRGYGNKKINYEEFKKLYKKYGKEMEETEFALILGISRLSSLKSKNIIILKYRDLDEKTRKQRETDIKNELLDRGYENKKIDYEEFKELYKEYGKGMRETDFASILGINDFRSLKNNRKNASILKSKEISKGQENSEDDISENNPYKLLAFYYIEMGMDKTAAMNTVMRELHITKEELLNAMQIENDKKEQENSENDISGNNPCELLKFYYKDMRMNKTAAMNAVMRELHITKEELLNAIQLGIDKKEQETREENSGDNIEYS